MATLTGPTYARARMQSFDGGWNRTAAPSELALNETPDCINITLDERGGVVKRLGLSKLGDNASLTTAPQYYYYSQILNKTFMQVGTGLYKSDDGGVNWSAVIKTFSTSARVGMCDAFGKAVIIHPIDGTFTYDGTTFSGKVTNSPNGNTITLWENALFSAGDPSNPTRLTRGDLGAITYPASPVFNDLRIKDDSPLTCLAPGPSALLAFKEESVYRVSDPTSLAYNMIGPTHGASGNQSVMLAGNQASAICRRGVTVLDGVTTPKLVSAKLTPIFNATQLNYAVSDGWCVGQKDDRYVFSIALSGSSVNNLTLEYHPQFGWFVPHNFGMQGYATLTSGTRRLLGAKKAANTHAAGFEVFKGGTDDGSAITSSFQTAWLTPAADTLCRLRRVLVRGRGNFQVEVRPDYAAAGKVRDFTSVAGGAIWGIGIWGVAIWGADPLEGYNPFWSFGTAHTLSYVFSQTSSTSKTGAIPVTGGIAPEIGDFACYGVDLDFIPLGSV